MKWASALSEEASLVNSIDHLTKTIQVQMENGPIDLAFLFVSSHFLKEYDAIPAALGKSLECKTLIGCSAGGVIGGGKEVEHRPAMALTVAQLPGVQVTPFHLDSSDLPDLDASPKSWQTTFHVDAESKPHFILLADPFSFDAEKGLMGLDFAYPAAVKIGGLASGGGSPAENALFLNDVAHRSGIVGVALSGNIHVDTIVAQGCRPIGAPLSITRCDRNLLMELDGKTPLATLQELYEQLSDEDQKKMQHSLFVGLAMSPFKETLSRGDFLIRNLIGMDPKTGNLAVGAILHEGQTVQFHLRDAETSADDLQWLLTQYQLEGKPHLAKGALLFSCLGRGEHLYGTPNHDTSLFQDKTGLLPVGGFFCNGEIGAVGGTTFLHGYTSCFGIFKPA
jgi:small ligand-binding sensory domain FIST